ncbi:hypothetical protein QBC35DRAFT_538375 [Podospora australis]|uniref:Rhodopsin domain-containing protein n=1 Tax=Podospora australis TaxID=1536484 RepID=A0AAN6WNE0_9PEZI|nr:hypothetical protein QBC35DRAFT_538375 [Podospora australis]
MGSMSTEAFLALGVTLITLTALLVIVRIVFNTHKAHLFFLEDGLAVAALCFLITKFTLLYASALEAASSKISSLKTLQLEVAFHFMGAAAMWTSKASILVLLIRLFGTKKWLRTTSFIAMFTSLVVFIVCVILAALACSQPIRTRWHSEAETRFLVSACFSRANVTSIVRGGVAIALDLVILILPLPIIYELDLPPSRKIGLFLVFSVGLFVLATGIASLYFKISSEGFSTDWPSRIGTTIDCSIAIMVGCVPALYGAWHTYVEKSSPFSKVRSVFSSFSSSVWHKFHLESGSHSRSHQSNGSSQQHTIHIYKPDTV